MSFHKASLFWQCFKREGKSPNKRQNSSSSLFVTYCLWKSGIRILFFFLVEIELNDTYDIVVLQEFNCQRNDLLLFCVKQQGICLGAEENPV